MDEALLDSDTLSEILKAKNPQLLGVANQYLAEHGQFAFSEITFYEVLRGFHANRRVRGLAEFLKLADASDLYPVSVPVLKRAARLWAAAHHAGNPRNDADLIIAATALEHSRVLVTGNTAHFAWIPGLSLENWRIVSS